MYQRWSQYENCGVGGNVCWGVDRGVCAGVGSTYVIKYEIYGGSDMVYSCGLFDDSNAGKLVG